MTESESINITIPVNQRLEKRLKEVAKISKKSEQELILEALENHLKQFPPSQNCYDLAKDLGILGVAEDLPSDLSNFRNYKTL
ncbi:MAG: hypothetical protein QNJ42_13720 [Crocosphaera sp.]|nr:hypothetical protein [Crocosphaera sp.]